MASMDRLKLLELALYFETCFFFFIVTVFLSPFIELDPDNKDYCLLRESASTEKVLPKLEAIEPLLPFFFSIVTLVI